MAINSLKPLRAAQFDYWKAQHLLNRAGFGGTPSQVRALANMGLADAVDYVVDYGDLEYEVVRADAFDHDIMRPATADERRELERARNAGDEDVVDRFRRQQQERQRADRRQMADVQRWWLQRMIETPRPLEEKMTLFWHGHFATGYRTIEDSYHIFRQNQLFRTQAVGNFRELAHAIIHDPAMLRYLNNDQNRRQQPNENLARELMELFTLGEGHAYTEADIKEGARALTGYTYADDAFVFRPRMHDGGEKSILGRVGEWDGDEFVDIILTNDVASEFLCFKLYRFFVNDLPAGPDESTQGFIIKLAAKFRESGYDIKPALRTLFMSAHFHDDANIAAQVKSPIQLVVQSVRSLRTPVRDLGSLVSAAALMGQNICYPPSVKGWDGGRSWINTATLFVRQNLLLYLLTGRRPDAKAWEADGAPYEALHLIEHLDASGAPVTTRDAAVYLLRCNLGREPHPDRIETLTTFIDSCGGRLDNDVMIGALSLIAAMPEFQLC